MGESDKPTHPWAKYGSFKDEIIALLGGKCARCGSTDKLQVDHIDRTKKSFNITPMFVKIESLDEIMDEIKKCQLLCPTCHTSKSIEERGLKVAKGTHGTLSSYRYCKCPECVAAHAKYCADWKKRKKRNKKRRAARRTPK